MSIAAPSVKRPWALVGIAAAILVVLVAALVLTDLPGERLLSPGARDNGSISADRELPQAAWRVKTHPAGVMDKVTKAQAARIQRQRPQVAALVRDVYDAVLLHPGRLRATLAENFTPAAASALRRSGVVVSEPGVVSTTKRRAKIGIQAAGGPTLAIATVRLEASHAARPDRPIAHDATLWMERGKKGWKVVAFHVNQRPVPVRTDGGRGDAKKQQNSKKPGDKKNKG